MSSSTMGGPIRLKGSANFRQRITFATLSARTLRIDEIRSNSEKPGLNAFESNFLRLVDKLTNGSRIEINDTGTRLRFVPGVLHGGEIQHDCGDRVIDESKGGFGAAHHTMTASRSIGYVLEGILPLLPFCKEPLRATFRGITNDCIDLTMDTFRTVTIPLLCRFGDKEFGEKVKLVVKKRGAAPAGGGEVFLSCPLMRQLKPIQFTDQGMVKRIRGVAYAARVSPQMANRTTTAARALFNHFIPDVHIFTDHVRGLLSGKSPGYGVTVVAETTSGVLYSAECDATEEDISIQHDNQYKKPRRLTPEEVGEKASRLLLEEIAKGGCVDTSHQSIAFTLMALSPEDISQLRIGKLSSHGIQTLRNLKKFFGVTFRLVPERKSGTVLCSCLGSGFTNFAKKVT